MFDTDAQLDRALDQLSPAATRDDAALARVHNALLEHIAQNPTHVTTQSDSDGRPDADARALDLGSRRRRLARRLAAPLAVAAAAAVVGTAVWSGPGGGAGGRSTAGANTSFVDVSAADAKPTSVRLVANAAAHDIVESYAEVPAGKYMQVRTVIAENGTRRFDTTWVPADPASRTDKWVRQTDGETVAGFCGNTYGPNTYYGTNDEYKMPPGGDAAASCDRPGNWRDQTQAFVASLEKLSEKQLAASLVALPCSEPDAVVRSILCTAGKPTEQGIGEMLDEVTKMLGGGFASAELSARLYQVVAALPGVTAQSGVTNADGVAGNALTYAGTADRSTMILDRSTGQLIGTREHTDAAGGNPASDYVDAIERTVVAKSAVPGL